MIIDDESNRLMTAMLNMLAESDPRLSQELTAAVKRQIDANADKTQRKIAKLSILYKQKQTTFRELVRKVAAMDEFASIASNPKTSRKSGAASNMPEASCKILSICSCRAQSHTKIR